MSAVRVSDADAAPLETQRIDKWLWFARVIKTRTQAALLVTDGKVRVNRQRIEKPSQAVRPGDVVTISVRGHIRVLKVVACGLRRGPATEASALFEIVETALPAGRQSASPADADVKRAQPQAVREHGSGRPTKRDRRLTERLRDGEQ